MSDSWDILGCIKNLRTKLGLPDIVIDQQKDDQPHTIAHEQAAKMGKSDSNKTEVEEVSNSLPVTKSKNKQVQKRSNLRVTSNLEVSKAPIKEAFNSRKISDRASNKFISTIVREKIEGKQNLLKFIKDNSILKTENSQLGITKETVKIETVEPLVDKIDIEEVKRFKDSAVITRVTTDNFPVYQRHTSLSEISNTSDCLEFTPVEPVVDVIINNEEDDNIPELTSHDESDDDTIDKPFDKIEIEDQQVISHNIKTESNDIDKEKVDDISDLAANDKADDKNKKKRKNKKERNSGFLVNLSLIHISEPTRPY